MILDATIAFFSKPDKGKGEVIVEKVRYVELGMYKVRYVELGMYKVRYVESMQKIISDHTKFQEITQPMHKYVIKIEDKINNFLPNLIILKFYHMIFTGKCLLLGPVLASCTVCLKFINLTWHQLSV